MLTAVSSVVTYYSLYPIVVVCTATTAALTAWQEFADWSNKASRYSRASLELKKLMYWWMSLSDIEQASRENIANLVESSEKIIGQERLAWLSTSTQQEKKKKKNNTIESNQKELGHADTKATQVMPV